MLFSRYSESLYGHTPVSAEWLKWLRQKQGLICTGRLTVTVRFGRTDAVSAVLAVTLALRSAAFWTAIGLFAFLSANKMLYIGWDFQAKTHKKTRYGGRGPHWEELRHFRKPLANCWGLRAHILPILPRRLRRLERLTV